MTESNDSTSGRYSGVLNGFTRSQIREAIASDSVTEAMRMWWLSADERKLPQDKQDEILVKRVSK